MAAVVLIFEVAIEFVLGDDEADDDVVVTTCLTVIVVPDGI